MADRRKCTGRAAAVLVAATVATATAGCGGDAGGTPAPDGSAGQSPTPATTGSTALACGADFTPPTGGGLYLTGRFPATAPVSGGTVAGTVEVKSPRAVRGVVGQYAEVFLVRDGRIATVPGPQDALGVLLDLEPGQGHEMPATADLRSCAPLTPGTYHLYAHVTFTPDQGTPTNSYAGPWPMTLT